MLFISLVLDISNNWLYFIMTKRRTGEGLVGLNTVDIKGVMVFFLSIAHTTLSEADQNQSCVNLGTKRKSGRGDRSSFLP